MNFTELVGRLVQDTFGKNPESGTLFLDGSLLRFCPELVLVATILALLFVRLFGCDRRLPGTAVSLFGSVAALLVGLVQFAELKRASFVVDPEFFSGLLVFDHFTVFFRLFLLLFLFLVIYLTRLSGIPDEEDAPDFYTLLIGSTIGMMLMVSANHLLILFLGIEMTSVPSYALVGFLKGKRTSSEASLKYVVYGGGAAGVMLYGISLIAGMLGTASFPEMAERLSVLMEDGFNLSDPLTGTIILGLFLVLVGFGFKLSVFPFHFWAPDAFEGAPAEVGGFLSVGSKAAAFALLVRFCISLVGQTEAGLDNLAPLYLHFGLGIGAVAAATATFGNLAAYSQTNMKRMLAYSTIAHAGYMLMAVSAMMVILNGQHHESDAYVRADQAGRAIEGLIYYLWVYLFMNLGAFAIVALIRNETYSEEIPDYAGLAGQAPVLCAGMAVCLFSLVGMPPFGGFIGKFMIFYSLFQATYYHPAMWAVLILGGVNTVFSLFYYVNVLRYMFVAPRAEGARPVRVKLFSPAGIYVAAISGFVLLTGVIVEPWSATAQRVASVFFP